MNKTPEGLKEKTKEIFDLERKLEQVVRTKAGDNQLSRIEQEAATIAAIERLFHLRDKCRIYSITAIDS